MQRSLLPLVIIFITFATHLQAKQWIVYEGCELLEDADFGGDTLLVKARTGYTYVFCLYGVDCPERNDSSKSRLAEQGREFRMEEHKIMAWGEEASRFVRKFLSEPFTVFTQKIKAGGGGEKSRYYAVIVNAEGERLDEALIEAGLARSEGMGAEWDEPFWGRVKADLPRRSEAKRFLRKLHALESKAKRERTGIWQK